MSPASIRSRISELRKQKLVFGDAKQGYRVTNPGFSEAARIIKRAGVHSDGPLRHVRVQRVARAREVGGLVCGRGSHGSAKERLRRGDAPAVVSTSASAATRANRRAMRQS